MIPLASMERSTRLAKYSLEYSQVTFKNLSIFPSPLASKRKVHRPGDVWSYGVMSSHPCPVTCSFVLALSHGDLEACLSPEAMDSFEVHPVPSCKDRPMGLPVALTRVSKCKGTQELGDLGIEGASAFPGT